MDIFRTEVFVLSLESVKRTIMAKLLLININKFVKSGDRLASYLEIHMSLNGLG